jgi:hypothetical protein
MHLVSWSCFNQAQFRSCHSSLLGGLRHLVTCLKVDSFKMAIYFDHISCTLDQLSVTRTTDSPLTRLNRTTKLSRKPHLHQISQCRPSHQTIRCSSRNSTSQFDPVSHAFARCSHAERPSPWFSNFSVLQRRKIGETMAYTSLPEMKNTA